MSLDTFIPLLLEGVALVILGSGIVYLRRLSRQLQKMKPKIDNWDREVRLAQALRIAASITDPEERARACDALLEQRREHTKEG